jgi:hypothetical protein
MSNATAVGIELGRCGHRRFLSWSWEELAVSKGQILGTAKTKPLADALRAKLGSLGDVEISLVSSDLENDPRRNSIARRGLDALARDKLIVVQVDDALPPLGLRDVARFRWSPAMADSEERIAAVAQALGLAQMRPPQERIKRPLDLFWVVLGAVVAVMIAVVVGESSLQVVHCC